MWAWVFVSIPKLSWALRNSFLEAPHKELAGDALREDHLSAPGDAGTGIVLPSCHMSSTKRRKSSINRLIWGSEGHSALRALFRNGRQGSEDESRFSQRRGCFDDGERGCCAGIFCPAPHSLYTLLQLQRAGWWAASGVLPSVRDGSGEGAFMSLLPSLQRQCRVADL